MAVLSSLTGLFWILLVEWGLLEQRVDGVVGAAEAAVDASAQGAEHDVVLGGRSGLGLAPQGLVAPDGAVVVLEPQVGRVALEQGVPVPSRATVRLHRAVTAAVSAGYHRLNSTGQACC